MEISSQTVSDELRNITSLLSIENNSVITVDRATISDSTKIALENIKKHLDISRAHLSMRKITVAQFDELCGDIVKVSRSIISSPEYTADVKKSSQDLLDELSRCLSRIHEDFRASEQEDISFSKRAIKSLASWLRPKVTQIIVPACKNIVSDMNTISRLMLNLFSNPHSLIPINTHPDMKVCDIVGMSLKKCSKISFHIFYRSSKIRARFKPILSKISSVGRLYQKKRGNREYKHFPILSHPSLVKVSQYLFQLTSYISQRIDQSEYISSCTVLCSAFFRSRRTVVISQIGSSLSQSIRKIASEAEPLVSAITPLFLPVIDLIDRAAISKELERKKEIFQKELDSISELHVASETASILSKKIIFLIKDQIVSIRMRESIFRAPFLKGLFDDYRSDNPQLNWKGTFLLDLLTTHENIIELFFTVNFLKVIAEFYHHMCNQQEKDRFCFVRFVQNCIAECTTQFRESHIDPLDRLKTLEDAFIDGAFQKELTETLFSWIFPNGKEDLIVPEIHLNTNNHIEGMFWRTMGLFSDEIKTAQDLQGFIKNFIWESVHSIVENQIEDLFESLKQDNDLKNSLIACSLHEIEAVLEGRNNQPVESYNPLKNSIIDKTSLTSIGILFLIMRLLISSVFSFMVDLLDDKEKSIQTPYPDQKKLNEEIEGILSYIQHESSGLIRWSIQKKKKQLSEALGVKMVVTLSKIKMTTFINLLFSKLLTLVIAPKGGWKGEKYIATFDQPSLKIEDEIKKIAEKEEERATTSSYIDATYKKLGSSIEGVVDIIFDSLKFALPKEPSSAESKWERMFYKIKFAVYSFLNSILRDCILLGLYLINAKKKIQEIVSITRRKADCIRQDIFLFSLSNYLQKVFTRNE